MIAILQRVSQASVTVEGQKIADIGKGFLILLGILKEDLEEDAQKLCRKILALRVFEDDAGKMNLNLSQSGGEILAVSQFTLGANLKGGNRPGFDFAMPPEPAKTLFDFFVECLRKEGVKTQTGKFGASMQVSLENDGPATFILNSWDL